MSIRVNLLNPSEARRQGMVGVKFMVHISLGTAVTLFAFFSVLGYMRYQAAKRDLAAARNIWEVREPMYNSILKMKEDLATEKKFQQELRGWQDSRIEWKPLLIELRNMCPPTVQLRRLSLRGELFVKIQPVTGGEAATPASRPTGQPMRWYSITLDGKAWGAQAEDVVVRFVRTFGNNSLFKPLFETAPRLNSLQREMSQEGSEPVRVFSIGAQTKKREIKEQKAPRGPQ